MVSITTQLQDAIEPLQRGELAVIPTDTIYGLVCRALDPAAVERLYRVRQRDTTKPCIILLAASGDLTQFDIEVNVALRSTLKQYWPGPVSVILPNPLPQWSYLSRGTAALAFRVPNDQALQNLLAQTGPLLAPSANPEGSASATSCIEAQDYFGSEVSTYVDGGQLTAKPSRLIRLDPDGSAETLRA